MPELPEVETVVRDLRPRLVGRSFRRVDVRLAKQVNLPVKRFQSLLNSRRITAMRRRGKVIIIELGPDWHLLIHLKMTGQLIWQKGSASIAGGHTFWTGYDNLPNKFSHVIFYLSDGGIVFFNDLRQFGWARLLSTAAAEKEITGFGHGPEPLEKDFTAEYFWKLTRRYPQRPLKQLLLDQKLIAGIGNIYADETLYASRLKPARRSGTLTRKQADLVYRSIRTILALAIKVKGTTIRNFRRGKGERGGFERYLKVFRRNGEKCQRDGATILKIRLGGRGTHYCPTCQR